MDADIRDGTALPALTGTLCGALPADKITAKVNSNAVTYPITPVLHDPNIKLGNYTLALRYTLQFNGASGGWQHFIMRRLTVC